MYSIRFDHMKMSLRFSHFKSGGGVDTCGFGRVDHFVMLGVCTDLTLALHTHAHDLLEQNVLRHKHSDVHLNVDVFDLCHITFYGI